MVPNHLRQLSMVAMLALLRRAPATGVRLSSRFSSAGVSTTRSAAIFSSTQTTSGAVARTGEAEPEATRRR